MVTVSRQMGRIVHIGSDPWGRFTWTELRGGRDEDILEISAYRVSQKMGAKVGPTTAYAQQTNNMILEGNPKLDPRPVLVSSKT